MSKKEYVIKRFSPTATRLDFSKIHHNFTPPKLHELQIDAYRRFLDVELDQLLRSYFPIESPNRQFRVEYLRMFFQKPERTEAQACDEGKTYEAPLYVDLRLVDTVTGTVKKAVKSDRKKKGKDKNAPEDDGVFFSNIPLMTENGSFIINGIEKFIVAQIMRSPGVYVSSKAQVKFLNFRKRAIDGYVCELLPSRGTLMFFYIDEPKQSVNVILRGSSGESVKVLLVTTFLKALGVTGEEILRLYASNKYIVNSLKIDDYTPEKILENPEIVTYIADYENTDAKVRNFNKGLPVDQKLRRYVCEYLDLKNELTQLESDESGSDNENKIASLQQNLQLALHKIVTEKAAKDIVIALSISIKNFDYNVTEDKQSYHYLLWEHFFSKRKYDLSSAGRYKLASKLRISERLYEKHLAEELRNVNGEVVYQPGKVLLRDEITQLKTLAKNNELDNRQFINFLSGLEPEKPKLYVETVKVSATTDNRTNEVVQVMGIDPSYDDANLNFADIVSIVSYVINLPYGIGSYDDIDHLGNKRLKLINELLRNRMQVGMARMDKYIRDRLAIADGSNKVNLTNVENIFVGAKPYPESATSAPKEQRITVKSVVNTKPFQLIIKDFFNTHPLTQFLDQQNPLAELTNKRRISAMGPSGISRDDPNLDVRDVHYSHYGRICPIETPEGMNIGLIISLTTYATIDSNGFLMSPYRKVIDGKVTDEYENFTALREDEYVIAQADSNLKIGKDNKIENPLIVGRFRSSQELYDPKKVDYIDISPKQVVSVAASLIPFLEHDDGSRALMGANMQRQAVPLLNPYAPVVGTGNEFQVAHESGSVVTSKEKGTVTYVDSKKIVVENDQHESRTYNLTKFRKSNQNACYNQAPIVGLNQTVGKDEVLTNGPAVRNSELALGQNILVGFTTWHGYNYEDAVILSDRLFKDDTYTSITINEYVVKCLHTKNGDEEVSRDIPNVAEDAKRYLNEDGVILVGAEVKGGDILVGKISPKGQVDLSAEEKLLQIIFGEKTKNIRDTSLRLPYGGDGVVCSIKHFSVQNGDELNDDVIEVIKVYVAQKRKIQIGDKMAGRHGNKGIISKIVPVEDMPHFEDGTPLDILLNPLGVPSRMNIGQIFELHLGYAAAKLSEKYLITFCFEKNQQKLQEYFNLSERVAQLFIKEFNEIITSRDLKTVDEALKKINSFDIRIVLFKLGLTPDDVSLKVSTPVFEGADREDLETMMRDVGIDPIQTHGKFKLFDGQTGEPFSKPISVGVMYMLKLNHMVDDKIHARSVGPYSKITQQPIGGRSQNGGQRFGEMEAWALEAYGAAYNLRELLTIKSDDVKGRNQTYNAIIRGKNVPEPILPESFKLLTKELQGLAIQIKMIKDDDLRTDINAYTAAYDDEDTDETQVDESFASDFNFDGDNL